MSIYNKIDQRPQYVQLLSAIEYYEEKARSGEEIWQRPLQNAKDYFERWLNYAIEEEYMIHDKRESEDTLAFKSKLASKEEFLGLTSAAFSSNLRLQQQAIVQLRSATKNRTQRFSNKRLDTRKVLRILDRTL